MLKVKVKRRFRGTCYLKHSGRLWEQQFSPKGRHTSARLINDDVTRHLRSVGKLISDYPVSHLKRQQSLQSTPMTATNLKCACHMHLD